VVATLVVSLSLHHGSARRLSFEEAALAASAEGAGGLEVKLYTRVWRGREKGTFHRETVWIDSPWQRYETSVVPSSNRYTLTTRQWVFKPPFASESWSSRRPHAIEAQRPAQPVRIGVAGGLPLYGWAGILDYRSLVRRKAPHELHLSSGDRAPWWLAFHDLGRGQPADLEVGIDRQTLLPSFISQTYAALDEHAPLQIATEVLSYRRLATPSLPRSLFDLSALHATRP
jgi:hypothetical protein